MKEKTAFCAMLTSMACNFGWVAIRVNDGECDYDVADKPTAEVYKRATDAGHGHVFFQKVDADGKPVPGHQHFWYVVAGNSASEFIADYSTGDGFDTVTDQCHGDMFHA